MNTQVLNKLYLLTLVVSSVLGNDIITLQGPDETTCLTINTEAPIFVFPLSENPARHDEIGKWVGSDWIVKDSKNSIQAPVLDKRWEGFETKKSQRFHLHSITSISFSIFSPKNVTLFLINKNFKPLKYTEKIQYENQWVHFSILISDYKTALFKNTKVATEWEAFKAEDIYIVSDTSFFYKLHKYQFRQADSVSEEPTVLSIPSTGKTCLTVYTSLCHECFLEINTSNNVKKHVYSSTETSMLMNSWHYTKIAIDPHKNVRIEFSRKNNQSRNGSWALDVRPCPHFENNMAIYKTKSGNVTTECKLLQSSSTERENSDLCENKVGKLGKNCSISCAKVLGPQFPHCEEHRICIYAQCECAWGYHGENCNEICDHGKWGLSCRNECKCKKCYNKTGNCIKKFGLTSFSDKAKTDPSLAGIILFAIAVALSMVIAIAILLCRRTNSRRMSDNYNVGVSVTRLMEDSQP